MIKGFIKKVLKKSFDENLRFRALWNAMRFISWNKIRGNYLEFGVWEGYSFIRACEYAEELKLSNMRFFAFDSFKGLPYDEASFKKGDYACEPGRFWENVVSKGFSVSIVEGWFKDSLKKDNLVGKVAVVNIDCDVSSSVKEVLEYVSTLEWSTIILLIHDWFNNLKVPPIFDDWVNETGFEVIPFHNFDWCGKSFIIRRKMKR